MEYVLPAFFYCDPRIWEDEWKRWVNEDMNEGENEEEKRTKQCKKKKKKGGKNNLQKKRQQTFRSEKEK